jgi:hypothetical protein
MGRSLVDKTLDGERYAFTITHGSDRTIGLLSDEYYLMMQSDGSGKRLHHLNGDDPRQNIADKNKTLAEEMTERLEAMWNTIRYMRENNKPEQ